MKSKCLNNPILPTTFYPSLPPACLKIQNILKEILETVYLAMLFRGSSVIHKDTGTRIGAKINLKLLQNPDDWQIIIMTWELIILMNFLYPII